MKTKKIGDAPCKDCGYNGPGYYQPTHVCVRAREAAEAVNEAGDVKHNHFDPSLCTVEHECPVARLAAAFKAFVEPVERERDLLQEKLGRFQSVTSLTRQVRDAEKRAEAAEAELAKLRQEWRSHRVACQGCDRGDTAKASSAQCYNCRNKPYWEIEDLRAELAKAKEEHAVTRGHLADAEHREEGAIRALAEAKAEIDILKNHRDRVMSVLREGAGEARWRLGHLWADEAARLIREGAEAKANAEGAEQRGREAEREAVVGWLRKERDAWAAKRLESETHNLAMVFSGLHADSIERGDHLPPRPTQKERAGEAQGGKP